MLETEQIDRLREIFQEMNPVSKRTYIESHEEEATMIDVDGNKVPSIVTVSETVLEISVTEKTLQEMAAARTFSARQNEQLILLSDSQYTTMWMELLGGYVSNGGQIITPGAVPVGTDIFQWPLPAAADGTVTIANATDPWGGSYGYHVKISHSGGIYSGSQK